MSLKTLFKRKPGGTAVGNILRGVSHDLTGGLLGNGAMMIKQGETDPSAANARTNEVIGGAMGGVQTANAKQSVSDKFTGIAAKVMGFFPLILGGIVTLGGIIYFATRSKGRGRRRY